MTKRFTATEKWSDPWFRSLPPLAKVFFCYSVDNCDPAGVWVEDYGLASFCIGSEVTYDMAKGWFSGRVVFFGSDKMLILGFIKFQYGMISQDCKMHKPVFASLQKHGLVFVNGPGFDTLSIPYRYPIDTLSKTEIERVRYPTEQNNTDQDKTGQDQGKGVQRENQNPAAIKAISDAAYAAYPDEARKDCRHTGKGVIAQGAVNEAVRRFPDFPWVEYAELIRDFVSTPKNISTWAQTGADTPALESLRKLRDAKQKRSMQGVDPSWNKRLA